MNHFINQGLTIHPLGGFTDNTGTYGPFIQFVTERQAQTMGQILQEYEQRRSSMEKMTWDEITKMIKEKHPGDESVK